MFRKNAFSTILAISALLAMTFAILIISRPANAGPAKVEVCHIPPDDPENFHTITVSENALSAHIAHYDLGGACDGACAALCDDGDRCTFEDTGDCESSGCPVPQPVVCGDGQTCDPELGCVSVETECPCFSAEDLADQGSYSDCANPFPGLTETAGIIFLNGSLACSGEECSGSSLACGLEPGFITVESISTEQNSACKSIIDAHCGLSDSVVGSPVSVSQSAVLDNRPFLERFK